eukprot:PhM_4_TR9169/c0_g1_i2/m.94477
MNIHQRLASEEHFTGLQKYGNVRTAPSYTTRKVAPKCSRNGDVHCVYVWTAPTTYVTVSTRNVCDITTFVLLVQQRLGAGALALYTPSGWRLRGGGDSVHRHDMRILRRSSHLIAIPYDVKFDLDLHVPPSLSGSVSEGSGRAHPAEKPGAGTSPASASRRVVSMFRSQTPPRYAFPSELQPSVAPDGCHEACPTPRRPQTARQHRTARVGGEDGIPLMSPFVSDLGEDMGDMWTAETAMVPNVADDVPLREIHVSARDMPCLTDKLDIEPLAASLDRVWGRKSGDKDDVLHNKTLSPAPPSSTTNSAAGSSVRNGRVVERACVVRDREQRRLWKVEWVAAHVGSVHVRRLLSAADVPDACRGRRIGDFPPNSVLLTDECCTLPLVNVVRDHGDWMWVFWVSGPDGGGARNFESAGVHEYDETDVKAHNVGLMDCFCCGAAPPVRPPRNISAGRRDAIPKPRKPRSQRPAGLRVTFAAEEHTNYVDVPLKSEVSPRARDVRCNALLWVIEGREAELQETLDTVPPERANPVHMEYDAEERIKKSARRSGRHRVSSISIAAAAARAITVDPGVAAAARISS